MKKIAQFVICTALVFCALLALNTQKTSATNPNKFSPTELADYINYSNASREERGTLLDTLEKQKALWKVHLSLYQANTTGLTKEQREVVTDTLSSLGTLFVANRGDDAKTLLTSLKKRTFTAFPKEARSQAFGTLGGMGLTAQDAMFFSCSCHTLSDFCDSGETCREAACTNPTEWGCGWLLLESCNGGCIPGGGTV